MKREWKPGDRVRAIVRTRGTELRTVVRTDSRHWPWLVEDDLGGSVSEEVVRVVGPSFAVTIDVEDREQVERLLRGYYSGPGETVLARSVDNMQAALREFAAPTPPKPEEPLGLGAVVEDDKGRRWVRARTHEVTEAAAVAQWRSWPGGEWRLYANLPVVRILSPGVTTDGAA